MLERYSSPEGFELDVNSGMYYRYDYVVEENGEQTCWLTWFNAESGEYTQQNSLELKESEEPESLQSSEESLQEVVTEPPISYLPPENYQYHLESGLYYDLYTYVNEYENLVDLVTWFDSDSGEYAQVEYMRKEEPSKPPSIESFKPEPSKIKKEGEGKKQKIVLGLSAVLLVVIIGITWHMGILDKLPIPFLHQVEETGAQETFTADNCALQVQIVSPREAVIRLEVPDLQSEYDSYDKSFDNGHMIYNWEVLFGDYSIALNHINQKENKGKKIRSEEMQSSLWEYADENTFSTLIPFVENTIENQVIEWVVNVPDRNFSFYEIEEYKLNILDEDGFRSAAFAAEEVLKEEKVNISQSEFAHNNMYELMSDEDDDYIYTIYLSDPYWKFSMEGIGGPIYRIRKGEKNPVAEKMIEFGDGLNTASSIAVLGDYIYFSSYTYRNIGDSDQYAYFRIPKKGGKAEKIFEEEFSYIRAYEGRLYFLFPSKESYGVYDPDSKNLELASINVLDMVDVMQGGAKSEAYLFRPFSVYQGDLYAGCSFDYSGYYSKVRLSDGRVTPFLKTSLDGMSENDEGGVFIYGVNPFYLNQGNAVINSDINAFLCRTSENLIAVDKSSNGQGLVFKQIHEDGATFDNNMLFEVTLSEQSKPYAGIGNWIFLTDKAICIESNQVTETVWFGEAKDITNKWDLTQMKESLY
jgi:hypothetical protein